jgi:hypothetical protein
MANGPGDGPVRAFGEPATGTSDRRACHAR